MSQSTNGLGIKPPHREASKHIMSDSTGSASAAVAAAALAEFQLCAGGAAPKVADAKRLIATSYPKLFSRFNVAFYGHEDTEELKPAIDALTADVEAWLSGLPENFKTSAHAISRPKFGAVFVLKNAQVREALGEAWCNAAIDVIERRFDELHKALVLPKTPTASAPAEAVLSEEVVANEDAQQLVATLRAKNDELSNRLALIERVLVDILQKNYDSTVAGLVQGLLLV